MNFTQAELDQLLGGALGVTQRPCTAAVLTQVLENVLTHMVSLQSGLEKTNKGVVDVREYGDTFAGTLLAGVEESFDYYDLLGLIKEFKDGIARRRTA
jgi:hypothetical protein